MSDEKPRIGFRQEGENFFSERRKPEKAQGDSPAVAGFTRELEEKKAEQESSLSPPVAGFTRELAREKEPLFNAQEETLAILGLKSRDTLEKWEREGFELFAQTMEWLNERARKIIAQVELRREQLDGMLNQEVISESINVEQADAASRQLEKEEKVFYALILKDLHTAKWRILTAFRAYQRKETTLKTLAEEIDEVKGSFTEDCRMNTKEIQEWDIERIE